LGSLKRKWWERGQKKIFEKIIEYFPNLVKTMNRRSKKPSKPQASQKEKTEKGQQQKGIPVYFTIKLLKASDKNIQVSKRDATFTNEQT